MSAFTLPLNNVRLHETCLRSADYNVLPHIDNMKDAAADNIKAHAILLGIIARHGLADTFSLRLVHKRFDIPEGRIMVYEKITGRKHGDFVLCRPRIPQECRNARGLYFKAAPGGNMVAYEFTTEPGADLSVHEDFVAQFASAALKHGAQDVFALTALPICPQDKDLTEFKMDQALSTVLVPGAWLLPTQDIAPSTSTDWAATADYAKYADGSVPGNIKLNYTKTRSQHHMDVTYSRTRTDKPLGHAPGLFSGEGETPKDHILTVKGQDLREGLPSTTSSPALLSSSKPFSLLGPAHARQADPR